LAERQSTLRIPNCSQPINHSYHVDRPVSRSKAGDSVFGPDRVDVALFVLADPQHGSGRERRARVGPKRSEILVAFSKHETDAGSAAESYACCSRNRPGGFGGECEVGWYGQCMLNMLISHRMVEDTGPRYFGLDDAEVSERRKFVGRVRHEIEVRHI